MSADEPIRAEPIAIPDSRPYRVEIADGAVGCGTCGHGAMYTVVYTDESGEACQLSVSWEDREIAESVAEWMNMAYEAGFEEGSKGETP